MKNLVIFLLIIFLIIIFYLTDKNENINTIPTNKCRMFPCGVHLDSSGNKADYFGNKLVILNLGGDFSKYATRRCSRYRYSCRRLYSKYCYKYHPVTIKYNQQQFKQPFENDIIKKIKTYDQNKLLGKIIWGQHGFMDNCPVAYNKEMWLLYYMNDNGELFMLKNRGDAFEQRLDFDDKNLPTSDSRYKRYMYLYDADKNGKLTINDRKDKSNTNNTKFEKIEIRDDTNKLNSMNFDLIKMNLEQ